MKLLIYNLLFWFKPNKNKYVKSDETYIYSHPDYFSYLVTAISKDLKKEELIKTFEDFNLKQTYVFGKKVDIRFNIDFFNNFKFGKNVKKPAFFNKADVKVPYEIGRLQFLQKVLLHVFTDKDKAPDFDLNYLEEIISNEDNKIIFNSPMDVAIRLISLILVKNICSEIPFTKESSLYAKLDSFISRDFEYVKQNYEKNGNVVGNHYFVELAAVLFFIANFDYKNKDLECTSTINEISKEIDLQFNSDFTNFEASTHYTALMLEALIIIYLSLQHLKVENDLSNKIQKLLTVNNHFLKLLTNNGQLSQIGDNDSGRLLYFLYDEQNPLNLEWLNNLIEELIPDSKNYNHIVENIDRLENFDFSNLKSVSHKKINVFQDDFKHYSFPDFGLFIWRNSNGYFSIRCGDIGQNGVGGHAHYDQLSIECFSNNKWIARDPGTGTYTDDINKRNKFRSLNYHWGPNVNVEFPNDTAFDCFKLNNVSSGKVLKFDKFNFIGYADFNKKRIYRKVSLSDGVISIQDFSNDVELGEYTSWGEENNGIKVEFSEGYKRFI